jgi:hypothetical protein
VPELGAAEIDKYQTIETKKLFQVFTQGNPAATKCSEVFSGAL